MISPQAFDGFCLLLSHRYRCLLQCSGSKPTVKEPEFFKAHGLQQLWPLLLEMCKADARRWPDGWRWMTMYLLSLFLCVHCVHNKKLLIIDNIEHRGVWYFKFDSNRGVWYFKLNSHCVFLKRVIVFALRLAEIYSRAYHVASPRTTGQILQSDIDPRLNATCSRPLPLLVSA